MVDRYLVLGTQVLEQFYYRMEGIALLGQTAADYTSIGNSIIEWKEMRAALQLDPKRSMRNSIIEWKDLQGY